MGPKYINRLGGGGGQGHLPLSNAACCSPLFLPQRSPTLHVMSCDGDMCLQAGGAGRGRGRGWSTSVRGGGLGGRAEARQRSGGGACHCHSPPPTPPQLQTHLLHTTCQRCCFSQQPNQHYAPPTHTASLSSVPHNPCTPHSPHPPLHSTHRYSPTSTTHPRCPAMPPPRHHRPHPPHSPLGRSPATMAACASQYSTDLRYSSRPRGTPLPPSSRPSELRIMVMGCMGVS